MKDKLEEESESVKKIAKSIGKEIKSKKGKNINNSK